MAAQPRDVVEQYVKLVATGPTSAIVDLYAADAVVEDPIGTPSAAATRPSASCTRRSRTWIGRPNCTP